MKPNWQTFKAIFVLVIVVGIVFLAVDSIRSRSYSGSNLNFVVGEGAVTLTNPSNDPVPVQLVGKGNRAFTLASNIEGGSGTSTKQGTGASTTQVFDFVLPSGSSEFTVSRGTDVNFTATTPSSLQATVNPVSSDTVRTTLIALAAIVSVALFYISHLTGHRWIRAFGREKISSPVPALIVENGGQGPAARAYGDNRR